jgi:hypothetical protein
VLRRNLILAALAALAVVPPPVAGAGQASRTGRVPSAASGASRSALSWRITPGALGPLRVGMRKREFQQVVSRYAVRVKEYRHTVEGDPMPAASLYADGKHLARILFDDDRIYRIEIEDPHLQTPEGIRVGARLKTLARVYGRGKAGAGEGVVLVFFEAGRSYWLKGGFSLLSKDGSVDWKSLLRQNPQVETIIVVDR